MKINEVLDMVSNSGVPVTALKLRLVAPTAGAPCGCRQQALCQILPLESGRQPSVLPGHCVPYAPPSVALVVCWHLGISIALRASFWLVACGHVSGVCPAHPWALRASRGRQRGLPVHPQGVPSEPRWVSWWRGP